MRIEYDVVHGCKTAEEALAKSKLKVGQLAKIVELKVHGNVDGTWTLHPVYEIIPEIHRAKDKRDTGETSSVCSPRSGPTVP